MRPAALPGASRSGCWARALVPAAGFPGAAAGPARPGSRTPRAAAAAAARGAPRRGRAAAARAAEMNKLMQMLMGDKLKVPAPENCLPGRDQVMFVKDKHFVLNTDQKPPFREGLERVVFGTGCFWGTEKGFWRLPGVHATSVGYAAGTTPNPTYEEVCSGQTGHNEVVQVVYDPEKVAFADLLRLFYESHNPTQGMGQGNDMGTQYRSGIYYTTESQRALAEAAKGAYEQALAAKGYGPITTEILAAPTFYYAEDYHQQYLAKPRNRQYCSAMPSGVSLPAFAGWAPAGQEAHAPKLDDAYWDKYGPKPGCTIQGPNEQIRPGSW